MRTTTAATATNTGCQSPATVHTRSTHVGRIPSPPSYQVVVWSIIYCVRFRYTSHYSIMLLCSRFLPPRTIISNLRFWNLLYTINFNFESIIHNNFVLTSIWYIIVDTSNYPKLINIRMKTDVRLLYINIRSNYYKTTFLLLYQGRRVPTRMRLNYNITNLNFRIT